MAITRIAEEYEKSILDYIGLEYSKLKWCELGNQGHYSGIPAKKYYKNRGILQHVSIDLNGKDGALKIDLGLPVPKVFIKRFDVITNYGTVEHINNQYQAFKNIHEMCKLNGTIINAFPMIGHWPGHCRYYYSELFVKKFAKSMKYIIIGLTVLDKGYYRNPRNLMMITYQKIYENKFIGITEFNGLGGVKDTRNFNHTGDYSK